MANALVEAITGKGKIEYMGENNPLQEQFLRLAGMNEVCSLLANVAMNDENENAYALGVIFKMVSKELKDIAGKIDTVNAEICKAINELEEVRHG